MNQDPDLSEPPISEPPKPPAPAPDWSKPPPPTAPLKPPSTGKLILAGYRLMAPNIFGFLAAAVLALARGQTYPAMIMIFAAVALLPLITASKPATRFATMGPESFKIDPALTERFKAITGKPLNVYVSPPGWNTFMGRPKHVRGVIMMRQVVESLNPAEIDFVMVQGTCVSKYSRFIPKIVLFLMSFSLFTYLDWAWIPKVEPSSLLGLIAIICVFRGGLIVFQAFATFAMDRKALAHTRYLDGALGHLMAMKVSETSYFSRLWTWLRKTRYSRLVAYGKELGLEPAPGDAAGI